MPGGGPCSGGGSLSDAWAWAAAHGLCTAAAYPPSGSGGACEADKCAANVTTTGAVAVAESEAALQAAVALGPVAVGVNAAPWQFYAGGVFTGPCAAVGMGHT